MVEVNVRDAQEGERSKRILIGLDEQEWVGVQMNHTTARSMGLNGLCCAYFLNIILDSPL